MLVLPSVSTQITPAPTTRNPFVAGVLFTVPSKHPSILMHTTKLFAFGGTSSCTLRGETFPVSAMIFEYAATLFEVFFFKSGNMQITLSLYPSINDDLLNLGCLS